LRRARTVDSATGLTSQRLSLLSVLCFAGPRTVGQLADAEMVSRPAISRILNGLENDGLARRKHSTSDRRRVVVHATAKGRSVIESARRMRIERISEQLVGLTHADLDVVEAAAKVLASLDEEPRRAN